MYSITLGSERFLPEPRNNRGWPKTRKQLEWAMLVGRDMVPARTAMRMVWGDGAWDELSTRLLKQLAPFLAYIQEKKNALIEREFNVTTERMMREVAAIAMADRTSFVRPVLINGLTRFVGIPPDQLSQTQRIAVRDWSERVVETDDGPVVDYNYKLHGKRDALFFLGKHLGMLSETLLVEMMGRRAAAQITDYSGVSTADLRAAIETMEQLQETMLRKRAIPGKSEVVRDAETG